VNGVKVQICAWRKSKITANVTEEHRWPDLRTCLTEVLAALDFRVPDTISQAQVLIDRVTISLEFDPEVPRKLLVQAWGGAVGQLSEVLAIPREVDHEAEADSAMAQQLVNSLCATGDQKVIRLLKQLGYTATKEVANG